MKTIREEARNPQQGAIWTAAQERSRFTRADLVADTGYSASVVGEQVRRWKVKGQVVVDGREDGAEILVIAGPVPAVAATRKVSIEEALWDAMRTLRGFSPMDLVVALSVARPDIDIKAARSYCQALGKARYLRIVARASGPREARYRLIYDTGPKAPHLKRLSVLVDPNEGKVTWTPEVTS